MLSWKVFKLSFVFPVLFQIRIATATTPITPNSTHNNLSISMPAFLFMIFTNIFFYLNIPLIKLKKESIELVKEFFIKIKKRISASKANIKISVLSISMPAFLFIVI